MRCRARLNVGDVIGWLIASERCYIHVITSDLHARGTIAPIRTYKLEVIPGHRVLATFAGPVSTCQCV